MLGFVLFSIYWDWIGRFFDVGKWVWIKGGLIWAEGFENEAEVVGYLDGELSRLF